MKSAISIAAALMLAWPASAQSVRAGIEAWQKGDHEAAVAIWAPLAAKGDADAAFNLGQAHRLGKGVPLSLPRAQQYLEQAARKGHVDAATTLGLLLFQNGNRVSGLRWLRQSAEAGEPRAMLVYGTALFNGDGTTRDPVRAYAFVSRAAAQGLSAARATLEELDATMALDERQKGVTLARTMVAKPSAAPSKAAASSAKPAVANPASAAAPSGGWRIQLGAFGQKATADALYQKLRPRLDGRQGYFVPAGKVVRLQVGPYQSRAAAAAACASLGAIACFPVAAR